MFTGIVGVAHALHQKVDMKLDIDPLLRSLGNHIVIVPAWHPVEQHLPHPVSVMFDVPRRYLSPASGQEIQHWALFLRGDGT